jgi:glycosyltransferase involved in cell wall biosynthesis
MTISVIIPTYNRAAFIKTAIDSALQQTRAPDEVIVVDDGSTDDTPRILEHYGPPVRVIRQRNRGRSAARNVALAHATSDAIMFLDSDDWLMPTNLERCVEVLERRPEVGVVYTDGYIVDKQGTRITSRSETVRERPPTGMVLADLARRCFLTVSSMVRRNVMDGITFEEGRDYCEDYDVWRRLAVRCQFDYVDEPLMCYRFHDTMTITTRLVETLEAELEVQQRVMAMPEFERVPPRARAQAYCSHGAKQALLGRGDVGRRYFWRAIRSAPTYPGGYVLGAISLLGTRALQYAIVKRRQLQGNELGAEFGAQALSRQRNRSAPSSFSMPAPAQPELVAAERVTHG